VDFYAVLLIQQGQILLLVDHTVDVWLALVQYEFLPAHIFMSVFPPLIKLAPGHLQQGDFAEFPDPVGAIGPANDLVVIV
jgi:hypothetical protein